MRLDLGMRKKTAQKTEAESLYMLRLGMSICITCGKSNTLPNPFWQDFFNYGSEI